MAASATYAEKAANNDVTGQQVRGKPVFVKHRDIPDAYERDFYTEHMYKTLAQTVSSREITGIQKIRGLWRLYIESQKTRIELITGGLKVRNVSVAVYDSNPFLTHGEDTLRVRVKDVPLSASDSLITDELEKRKCKVVGKIIHQRLRVDGRLTDCLTGDRIIYIERPAHSLPRLITFGLFQGKVFHPGQVSTESSSVTCSRCLVVGHHRSQCTNDVMCRQCNKSGHIARECREDFPPVPPPSGTASTPSVPHERPADARFHAVHTSRDSDQLFATPPRAAASPSNETPASVRSKATHVSDASRNERPSDERFHTHPSRDCDRRSDSSNTTPAVGRSQAKITQFVNRGPQQDNAHQSAACEREEYTSNSQDDFSTAESDNSEDETVQEHSELSAESPELQKSHQAKQNSATTKRKQKSHKKSSKKK